MATTSDATESSSYYITFPMNVYFRKQRQYVARIDFYNPYTGETRVFWRNKQFKSLAAVTCAMYNDSVECGMYYINPDNIRGATANFRKTLYWQNADSNQWVRLEEIPYFNIKKKRRHSNKSKDAEKERKTTATTETNCDTVVKKNNADHLWMANLTVQELLSKKRPSSKSGSLSLPDNEKEIKKEIKIENIVQTLTSSPTSIVVTPTIVSASPLQPLATTISLPTLPPTTSTTTTTNFIVKQKSQTNVLNEQQEDVMSKTCQYYRCVAKASQLNEPFEFLQILIQFPDEITTQLCLRCHQHWNNQECPLPLTEEEELKIQ